MTLTKTRFWCLFYLGADTNALTFYDSTEYFLTIPITESETDWENIEKGILILSVRGQKIPSRRPISEQLSVTCPGHGNARCLH
jgi:hypothetical protein